MATVSTQSALRTLNPCVTAPAHAHGAFSSHPDNDDHPNPEAHIDLLISDIAFSDQLQQDLQGGLRHE